MDIIRKPFSGYGHILRHEMYTARPAGSRHLLHDPVQPRAHIPRIREIRPDLRPYRMQYLAQMRGPNVVLDPERLDDKNRGNAKPAKQLHQQVNFTINIPDDPTEVTDRYGMVPRGMMCGTEQVFHMMERAVICKSFRRTTMIHEVEPVTPPGDDDHGTGTDCGYQVDRLMAHLREHEPHGSRVPDPDACTRPSPEDFFQNGRPRMSIADRPAEGGGRTDRQDRHFGIGLAGRHSAKPVGIDKEQRVCLCGTGAETPVRV